MRIEKIEQMDAYVLKLLSMVGSQIKIARERRGLSVKTMGEICFCDIDTVNKIEYGDGSVCFSDVARVLTALYMHSDILRIACPENDDVGIFLSRFYANYEEEADRFNF